MPAEASLTSPPQVAGAPNERRNLRESRRGGKSKITGIKFRPGHVDNENHWVVEDVMTTLIESQGLRKKFGALQAVDGIDLTVSAGEVLGFLGPNGAGKSTTMRMLTGFLEMDAGSVQLAGVDLHADPLEARRRMGYLPEGAPAYPDMKVREFLMFVAQARGFLGMEAKRRVEEAVERIHLQLVLGQTVETLSKGFKRRVGLAQAMLHDPPVLILDEPTDGLDPNQKHEVRKLITEMGEAQGKAIVLSTHILEEVEAVCTRAVIINKGKVVADDTPEALRAMAPAGVAGNPMDHVFRSVTSGELEEIGA